MDGYSQRLFQSIIQPLRRHRNRLALNLVRKPRKILESPSCPSDIALRLPECLTLIRRLQPRKLVGILPNQPRKLRENPPPLPGIHVPPFRRLESSSSRINSSFAILFGRSRNLGDNFPARWINNR